MKNNFSAEVKETISLGLEEALRLRSDYIGTGHLLLGLIKQNYNSATNNSAVRILRSYPIDLAELKKEIESSIEPGRRTESEEERQYDNAGTPGNKSGRARRGLPLDRRAEKVIRESVIQARDAQSPIVNTEHLMLSMLNNPEDSVTKILNRFGLDYHRVVLQIRHRVFY